MASAASPAFMTTGVTKVYGEGPGAVHALRGVDLVVPEGELVVLLGPSGSGKSTLLNIMGGLDRATDGHVFFRGDDITTYGDSDLTRYRRDHVGFVFQFYNLMPSLTARENVELVTDIAPHPMTAEEALDLVDLGARMDHFPSQLSGGEQQRVAIARAIAKQPTVLFCDEPTGALDSQTGIKVLDVIQNINTEFGTTTLVITHARSIAAMGDRVLYFADGRLAGEERNAQRTPAEQITW